MKAFFHHLPILAFMAWRNIWRNPVRSVLTICALAGGLVMVILYAALLEGMTTNMVRYATEVSTGHLQVHRQAYIDDQDLYATMPWSYLDAIEQDLEGAHVTPRLYAAGLASTEKTSYGVMIRAVDPQRETHVTQMLGHIREGELNLDYIEAGTLETPGFGVVVGAQLARNLQISVGDELILVTQAADGSIGNALYQVTAILKPLDPAFDRTGVLLSIDAFKDLMYLEDGFHELAVLLDDINTLPEAQASLNRILVALNNEQPLDELGGRAVVRNWRELAVAVADMLDLSKSMIWVIGFVVVVLASLGMLNTMMMAIHERTHEFGILLAIGMKRQWLLLMVMLEALCLAAISALTGLVLGYLITNVWLKNGIDFSASMPDGFDYAGVVFEPVMSLNLHFSDALLACALMLVIALVASFIPSWRTVRLKPADVL